MVPRSPANDEPNKPNKYIYLFQAMIGTSISRQALLQQAPTVDYNPQRFGAPLNASEYAFMTLMMELEAHMVGEKLRVYLCVYLCMRVFMVQQSPRVLDETCM